MKFLENVKFENGRYEVSLPMKKSVCAENEIKVLGIPWNKSRDTLKFDLSNIVKDATKEPVTKRILLSTIARFYDPHGLISAVILPLKMLFQEVCLMKVDWDSPLPNEINDRWKSIIDDINLVSEIEFPRCLLPGVESDEIKSVELHGFSDASKIAYGANVYLRIETSNGISSHLIASKTRIAPLKTETIPRLELLAALLLAKLITSVSNALRNSIKIDKLVCWSDSQIVLWWIYREPKDFKVFVSNRLLQIRDLIAKENWFYCPTNANPSDIASRGIKCSILVNNDLWWKGPQFLALDSENWPKQTFCSNENEVPDEVKSEIKKQGPVSTHVLVNESKPVQSISDIIPCERFSSYTKLIRVTALVLKFVNLLRHKHTERELSERDIEEAESLWHREVQKSFENDEKFQKSRDNVRIFTDEKGVMRVGGRIENSTMPYNAKFPILLPRNHHFTNLYIWRCHFIVKHNGMRETLTELRSKYWIIGGRQVVKNVLSKCIVCKKFSAKPYGTMPAPPLPSYRVSDDFAFTKIGIDFAGPLYVKDIYSEDDTMNKCYIVVITCASTRAIHLELTPDLSADSFIRVMKRFIGRRGLPSMIVSDNGSTFRDSKVQKFISSRGC